MPATPQQITFYSRIGISVSKPRYSQMTRSLFIKIDPNRPMDTWTKAIPISSMHLSRLDRPDIRVIMCRYRNGKLERKLKSTRNTQYIAISHSWGNPIWQELPGVEGEVWVSKDRAKFILNRLPFIVGEQYFWMDILCVDQRNERADFDVPKQISIIFRDAQRTVIIRDGTGFQKCCIKAAGKIDSWFSE